MLEKNVETLETKESQKNEEVEENTISQNTEGQVTIPIKFNKVTKNLSIDEATNLAQKGMKFDSISADYERLKNLAAKKDMSVSMLIEHFETLEKDARKAQLLDKCSGDEELVGHIVELEDMKTGENDNLKEIKEYFPEITSPEMLPESVIESAKLKGTKLLDEYLRYQLNEKRSRIENEKSRREAENAGIGSQRRNGATPDPVNAEFLRGLWSR